MSQSTEVIFTSSERTYKVYLGSGAVGNALLAKVGKPVVLKGAEAFACCGTELVVAHCTPIDDRLRNDLHRYNILNLLPHVDRIVVNALLADIEAEYQRYYDYQDSVSNTLPKFEITIHLFD